MTEQTDNRPYSLRTVVIDDGSETPIEAYSNHDKDIGEWPVFTREQIDGLLDATQRNHFQLVWVDEIGTFANVVGYNNALPDDFDIGPYMASILKQERVERHDNGFYIDFPVKRQIEVDGEVLETFSFDHVGYAFCRALERPAPQSITPSM